jgi:tetratricopeptide (TPR) repeat protein
MTLTVALDNSTKINEMNITDEFFIVGLREKGKDIAKKLKQLGDGGVVLVSKGKSKVVGYIRKDEIIDLVSKGYNPLDAFASNLMNKNFMEVWENEILGNLIPKISKKYPNAIVVVNRFGKCVGYFSKNDYQEALAGLGCYDKSQKPEQMQSIDWRTRGIARSSMGQMAEALVCYERAIAKYSNKEQGWFELARSFEHTNRFKDAIMCYDQVITNNPSNDDAWYNKGNSYSMLRMPDRAVQSYVRALKLNPKNVKVLINMGVALSDQGQADKAVACYNKAESITGESSELWYKKGNAYDKAQKYKDAVRCYQKAIKLNNQYEDAWFNKGAALHVLGRDRKAIQCFQEVLRINPGNASAKEAIAICNEK